MQLYGWDTPLFIATRRTGTAWHIISLVTGEVSHSHLHSQKWVNLVMICILCAVVVHRCITQMRRVFRACWHCLEISGVECKQAMSLHFFVFSGLTRSGKMISKSKRLFILVTNLQNVGSSYLHMYGLLGFVYFRSLCLLQCMNMWGIATLSKHTEIWQEIWWQCESERTVIKCPLKARNMFNLNEHWSGVYPTKCIYL